MLVLSRRRGQEIHIGKDITISVSKMNRNQVWLGIIAPRDVNIVRGELMDEAVYKALEKKK